MSLAVYSLLSRAMRTASSLPRNEMPGVVIEAMEVATPDLSMSSSDFCTDQL